MDPFIAIYSPPEPNFKVPKLKLFEIRGFFAPAVIESLHRAKYEVFSVSGVEHAPIGFDNHENTYLNGGENDYSVVRTDKQNILFQAIKFFS